MAFSFREVRLVWIDYQLSSRVGITRDDLAREFGMSSGHAGADIRLFKQRHPQRMIYDRFEKCHRAPFGSEPVYAPALHHAVQGLLLAFKGKP